MSASGNREGRVRGQDRKYRPIRQQAAKTGSLAHRIGFAKAVVPDAARPLVANPESIRDHAAQVGVPEMVEGGGDEKAGGGTPAVFISYASQDAAAATRICSALRQAGIEVWFDQSELRGGDLWDQKIRQQIRDCALFNSDYFGQRSVQARGLLPA